MNDIMVPITTSPPYKWGSRTNERLPAIMAGMDLNSADKVIAISGSADFPFSALEFAGDVTGVDNDESQILRNNWRKKCLEDGNFDDFSSYWLRDMYDGAIKYNHPYFHGNRQRLETIRAKLEHIEFIHADILQFEGLDAFTKVYLSNICGFTLPSKSKPKSKRDAYNCLIDFTQKLSRGTLIYASDGDRLNPPRARVFGFRGLRVETELTAKARESEYLWTPTVFRRL